MSFILSCATVEKPSSLNNSVDHNLRADIKSSQTSLVDDKIFSILQKFSPSFLFLFSDSNNGQNIKALSTYNSVFHSAPKTHSDYYGAMINLPNDFKEIITIPTALHEAFHIYTLQGSGSKTTIYFGSNEKLILDTFPTFPSIVIRDTISTKIRTNLASRYSVYIDSTIKNMSTQKYGIFGLLNEYAAYFISAKTAIELIESFTELIVYDDKYFYLFYQMVQSYLVGLAEFKYFIASYLDYAGKNQRTVYEKLQSDISLKQVLSKLDSKTDELKIVSINNFKKLEENLNIQIDSDRSKTSNHNIVLSNFSSSLYLELDKSINEELLKPRMQRILINFFQ